MAEAVYLNVDRDGWTGGLQLSIGDDAGGFRLAGPKFNGSGERVLTRRLDQRDVTEIRRYLDAYEASLPESARTCSRAFAHREDGDHILCPTIKRETTEQWCHAHECFLDDCPAALTGGGAP